MKAILRYTDCGKDQNIVFGILANENIKIIKTKPGASIYPKVFIEIEDTSKLNKLLIRLNINTIYGVTLVKVKNDNWLRRLLNDR